MSLRELVTEYIMFAFTDDELAEHFLISVEELTDISDEDLLEIYDQTLLFHTIKPE